MGAWAQVEACWSRMSPGGVYEDVSAGAEQDAGVLVCGSCLLVC